MEKIFTLNGVRPSYTHGTSLDLLKSIYRKHFKVEAAFVCTYDHRRRQQVLAEVRSNFKLDRLKRTLVPTSELLSSTGSCRGEQDVFWYPSRHKVNVGNTVDGGL